MITITSIWGLPLVAALWALNTWLFLAGLRLALGQMRSSSRAISWAQSMAALTDGIPHSLVRWLSRRGHAVASWLPWAVAIVAGLILRQLLLRMVIAFA